MGAGLLLLVQGKLVKSRIVTAAVSSRLLGRDWLLNRELLDATAASLLRTAVFLLVVVLVVCLQLGAADSLFIWRRVWMFEMVWPITKGRERERPSCCLDREVPFILLFLAFFLIDSCHYGRRRREQGSRGDYVEVSGAVLAVMMKLPYS
ncbi:hypothetical protein E3N88_32282 [Mikania micrantha]|uniref:Uncharacterized protein n=1 Tax=Mikania micrantha TaxID=192012 RepID=A0A5N6M8R6_9ASTR|nr:hypothetical protein E3N88_32282 [Mikania micrantha]